jgi:hypothetical protein
MRTAQLSGLMQRAYREGGRQPIIGFFFLAQYPSNIYNYISVHVFLKVTQTLHKTLLSLLLRARQITRYIFTSVARSQKDLQGKNRLNSIFFFI